MYISLRHAAHHELTTTDPTTLTNLQKQGIKIKITNGKAYAIKPSLTQLKYLAKNNLLKGVSVVLKYSTNTYEILPKPAAILCHLANTCKIIKTFPNSTQALEYLKKLK